MSTRISEAAELVCQMASELPAGTDVSFDLHGTMESVTDHSGQTTRQFVVTEIDGATRSAKAMIAAFQAANLSLAPADMNEAIVAGLNMAQNINRSTRPSLFTHSADLRSVSATALVLTHT